MQTAEKTTKPGFHVDVLDGLRAIAIALVVWLHVWQLSWMRNEFDLGPWHLSLSFIPETGFTGVELFFFISGACLFFPYARHMLAGAALPKLGTYWYRRLIKIVPSYWLAIGLILVLFKPGFFAQPNWPWLLGTHLVFVQNLFHETEAAINGVFWSLGVEVQFYVIFPLIAWLFRRFPLPTYVLMVASAVGWRYGVQAWGMHDYRFLLDQLPGYLDFFANGMLAAYALVWLRDRVSDTARSRAGFTIASLVGFALFGWLLNDLYAARIGEQNWPWHWQVEHRAYLGATFLAIAVSSAYAFKAWRVLLANPLTVFLSTISYNLYIWHQLLARELMARKIPMPTTEDPHADPAWTVAFTLVAIGVSVAVAALMTYAFERPLLREGFSWLLKPVRRSASPVVEPPKAA